MQEADKLNVKYTNENKDKVVLGGTEYNNKNGGTRLTNVAYATGKYGSEAVNVDYLEDTVDSINKASYKGWTVSANGETKVAVPSNGNVDFSNIDENIIVGQTGTNLTFDLNSVVKLDGNKLDGDSIELNGKNGSINAVNSNVDVNTDIEWDTDNILGIPVSSITTTTTTTSNEFNFDENGGKFVTTEAQIKLSTDSSDSSITKVTHAAEFNGDGATFTKKEGLIKPDVSTTNIDGGTITISSDARKGSNVVIDGTTGEMTGLSNTTVDYQGFATEGKAATEEQLKKVQENLITADRYITGGTIDTTSGKLNLTGTNGLTATVSGLTDYQVTADGSSFDKTNNKLILNLKDTLNTSNVDKQVTFEGIASTDDVEKAQNAATTIVKAGDNIEVSEPTTASEDGHKEYTVSLKDNITLGEGPNQIQLNGAPEANDPALSVGTDKFVVDQDGSLSVSDKFNVDAETGNIYAANNSGSAIVMNDDSVAFSADGNGVVASDEGILLNTNGLDKDIRLVTKGTTVSVDKDGATFTNTNTNETTNINGGTINVGDKLVVDQDGTTTIAVNDGTVMGNNTTMTVNKDGVAFSAYGNGTTVIDGQTIYAGGVVINNNGSGTINGLTNTTWDDELAKQVANSEELQGTAATQGQLQQAVSEVSGIVNKGWTAKAGDNDGEINITPGDILNFEGDGNITVSATGGTSNELKFGLNDNITLGDKAGQKTSTSLTLYTDSTPKDVTITGKNGQTETVKVTGYIPESYIDDQERVDNFISTHGGFMMYATNTSGDWVFGVTTDGMVHVKDVISYMPNSDLTSKDKILKYSLNDIGDIVTQIAHGKFNGTGMEYTLISDFTSEEDKDTPFVSTDNSERTIGLAVRQDGAVIVGAVVDKSGNLDDSGIRINAETETTYDKDGNEVTNNIATITGLENTEWKPKAPEQTPQAKMATFAANDGTTTTETSRAATEAQLDDLYNVVSVYNTFDNNGNVNYNTIKLRGDEYSYNKENPVDSKGTSIINVAYASGTVGSEAVNVDYLNDAIAGVKTEASGSDKYLSAGAYDQESGKITLTVANSQDVVIDGIASKNDITNLDNKIDSINDKIEDINTAETDVKGGSINEDGTISLKTENDDGTTTDITLNGNLTDSGVIQDGTSFDGETGTLTITSQDKYSKETSSVTVSGIASKDDIGAVTDTIGVTSSEDLKDAYKDADKDGNATTEFITESGSMVEADVALDHAIQDVANTSYANDMVLSNRIDSVEKRLGNVEERIDKVGAMAAAIANLRTMGFDPEAPTEIAIGVGQYKSETGLALGVFHYPNQDFMLSASISTSGDEVMGGIGATWKLGRKSAAEKAKDEEARRLEKAEEMKKLAQDAKVKAQAERHAKLLAEREAQKTA